MSCTQKTRMGPCFLELPARLRRRFRNAEDLEKCLTTEGSSAEICGLFYIQGPPECTVKCLLGRFFLDKDALRLASLSAGQRLSSVPPGSFAPKPKPGLSFGPFAGGKLESVACGDTSAQLMDGTMVSTQLYQTLRPRQK